MGCCPQWANRMGGAFARIRLYFPFLAAAPRRARFRWFCCSVSVAHKDLAATGTLGRFGSRARAAACGHSEVSRDDRDEDRISRIGPRGCKGEGGLAVREVLRPTRIGTRRRGLGYRRDGLKMPARMLRPLWIRCYDNVQRHGCRRDRTNRWVASASVFIVGTDATSWVLFFFRFPRLVFL